MGGLSSARLKKYLVNDTSNEFAKIKTHQDTKIFIKKNCKVRWIIEKDMKTRGYLEGFFTGILKPIYGIYEEH